MTWVCEDQPNPAKSLEVLYQVLQLDIAPDLLKALAILLDTTTRRSAVD